MGASSVAPSIGALMKGGLRVIASFFRVWFYSLRSICFNFDLMF